MKRTNAEIEGIKPYGVRRTNPIVEQAMTEIKQVITEDGCATISDYKALVERYKLPDEILLPAMQHSGLGFVRTKNVPNHPETEVIVDLRVMAAAMLLIYAEDGWAADRSVFDYLAVLHTCGPWRAAFPLAMNQNLLRDIYSTYGHHFSDMEMADNSVADIAPQHDELIAAAAERSVHAITELTKSDDELTEVFHLALKVFSVLNNWNPEHPYAWHHSIVHRRFKDVKAYEHFWRLAIDKILVPHRKARVEAIARAKAYRAERMGGQPE